MLQLTDVVEPRGFFDNLAQLLSCELVGLELTEIILIVPERAIAGEEVGADLRCHSQF